MKSSGNHKIIGKVKVDETFVGGQEEGMKGRKNNKKKLVVFAIEKKNKGVNRMYGKVIEHSSSKEMGAFMSYVLDKQAKIKTDKWTGYNPLRKDIVNLVQVESGKIGR